MLLVAIHVNYFASHSASPGSLYVFVARGLGPAWGIIAGWSLVLAYLFTASAVFAGAANYASVLYTAVASRPPSTLVVIIFILLTAALAWAISYKDLKLSTRAMLALEFASVGLILLLAFAFLAKSRNLFDPAQLHLAATTGAGLRQGMVLAVFSYVGFESATALGAEAKDPLRTIPNSVLLSVLLVGAMFVFMSYVLVAAFQQQSQPLDRSNAPLSVLAQLAGLPFLGYAIALGAIISFFACALASINAAGRVIFTMARHQLLHASAGTAHHLNATPHVALTMATLAALSPTLALVASGHTASESFGYLGSLATFGFLLAYVLLCVAAPMFLRTRHELTRPRVLITVVTLILLALPIMGSLYPVPRPPSSYLPFIFLGLITLGLAWFGYLRASRPALLQEIEQDLSN